MEASLERRAALDAARDVRRLEMLATNAQARAGLRILFSEARRHGLGVSFAGGLDFSARTPRSVHTPPQLAAGYVCACEPSRGVVRGGVVGRVALVPCFSEYCKRT